MKVTLEKTFPMPASQEVVWCLLQNIEAVAGCMPGARITERVDDTHFKGSIAVKLGPASMSFKGDIEVRDLDTTHRVLRLIGKGSDSSGTSGASLDLTARVEAGASDGASNLVGNSEVTMSGKAAAFGGRMMATVADQILKQFAGNFTKHLSAIAAAQAVPATVTDAIAATATEAIAAANSEVVCAAAPDTVASATPTAKQSELNALALVWVLIRDWFRDLFRRKPA